MKAGYRIYRFLWSIPWLPQRVSRSLYKQVALRGAAPDFPFVQDFFGIQYRGNLNNNVDFHIYFYGAFEKPLLFFLRDTMHALAAQQTVFIDVGANVGQHSLFMAAHGASVHAFEPLKQVRERLLAQIDANRLDNICVHPLGLGNENARIPFFAPTGNNLGIGSFDPGTVSKGNVNIGDLELAAGDSYFQTRGIDAIDLIKIDVEGFEKLVLQGLQESLGRTRPIVVCEITYGNAMSFASLAELQALLPGDYALFTFDMRKADGSKARRRDARSRHSGHYRLIPFDNWLKAGQDDVIACPFEKTELMPRHNG